MSRPAPAGCPARSRSPRGIDVRPRRHRPQDFDEARRAGARLGAAVLGAEHGVGADGHRLARTDPHRPARADLDLAATLPPAPRDQAVSNPLRGVGGAKGIAVEGGAVERRLVDVADGRLGQDQPHGLGQRDLDRLARLGPLQDPCLAPRPATTSRLVPPWSKRRCSAHRDAITNRLQVNCRGAL